MTSTAHLVFGNVSQTLSYRVLLPAVSSCPDPVGGCRRVRTPTPSLCCVYIISNLLVSACAAASAARRCRGTPHPTALHATSSGAGVSLRARCELVPPAVRQGSGSQVTHLLTTCRHQLMFASPTTSPVCRTMRC